MAHNLVMITADEDGEPTNMVWCYITTRDGSPRTMCKGECFGFGEGAAEYKTKRVERGGITCKDCLNEIKEYKAIKL